MVRSLPLTQQTVQMHWMAVHLSALQGEVSGRQLCKIKQPTVTMGSNVYKGG